MRRIAVAALVGGLAGALLVAWSSFARNNAGSPDSAIRFETLLPQSWDAMPLYMGALDRFVRLHKDAPKDSSELAGAPSVLFFKVAFTLDTVTREGDYVAYAYELWERPKEPVNIAKEGKPPLYAYKTMKEKEVVKRKVTNQIPIPGTPAYEQSERGQREHLWATLKMFDEKGMPRPEGFEDATEDDVVNRRIARGELERLEYEAKTEKERFFIRWAHFLVRDVSMLVTSFWAYNWRPPASFSELASFAGGLNEPGWINPLTGEQLKINEGAEPTEDTFQFYIDEENERIVIRMPTFSVVSQSYIEKMNDFPSGWENIATGH